MEAEKGKEVQWMAKISAAILIPALILAGTVGFGILDLTTAVCCAAGAALILIIFLHRSLMRAFRNIKKPLLQSVQNLEDSYTSVNENLKAVSAELDSILPDFQNAFDGLESTAGSMSASAEELFRRADGWAKDTGNLTENADALGEGIAAALESAETVSDREQRVDEQIRSEKAILEEYFKSSRSMGLSVSEVQKQANHTNHLALELKEAMEVVADIASQTDLIALNASIEAARAGEKDKGFSIVAAEIRTLAEQCRKTSDQLSHMADTLAEHTGQSVQRAHKAMEAVGDQNDKLEDVAAAFEETYREIADGSRQAGTLLGQMKALDDKNKDLPPLLEQLSVAAQENTENTKNILDLAVQLRQETEECRKFPELLKKIAIRSGEV